MHASVSSRGSTPAGLRTSWSVDGLTITSRLAGNVTRAISTWLEVAAACEIEFMSVESWVGVSF